MSEITPRLMSAEKLKRYQEVRGWPPNSFEYEAAGHIKALQVVVDAAVGFVERLEQIDCATKFDSDYIRAGAATIQVKVADYQKELADAGS